MNSFELVALLSHHLKLKSNYVIMLLRNLKQSMSLYNETRLQVKRIESKTLDCYILEGEHNDKRH